VAFNEALYKRGTGAQGGQFVAKDGTKSSAIGYDGKRGSGYGSAGGDSNVKELQKELNRLGITDAQGKELAVDGKFGPKTTAAVMRLQRKLKLPADGKITPALLKRIKGVKRTTTLTEKPAKKAAPSRKAGPPPAPARKITPTKKAAPVRRSLSYSMAMDSLERHGTHNQKSHGNRLGRPENVGGKTGLAKATSALADKPKQGPERAAKARTLRTYAERREAVREHSKLTREDFDQLSSDRQAAILNELRQAESAGDTHTSRDGMGISIRGKSTHVTDATALKRRFTQVIQPLPDDSVDGRASRLKSATTEYEVRNILYKATKAQMDAIAEKNGWLGGTSSSWKTDKWIAHLTRKALGGK
jgi:hypothetical protein